MDSLYEKLFSESGKGAPGEERAPSAGALIIKEWLGLEDLNWVQELIVQKVQQKQGIDLKEDPSPSSSGKLIVDTTVASATINYPTDVDLLNEARKKTEAIIEMLHEPLRGKELKVRAYRQQARQEYLRFAKKRKHTERQWRKEMGSNFGICS